MSLWQIPENEPETIERPPRPLGVSVLTIWNGMTAGLFPIITTTVRMMGGTETVESNPLACLSPLIAALIVFTAIGAWRGHDGSRLGHILVLVLYNGILAFNTFGEIAIGLSPEEQVIAYVRITGYALWAILNAWYFLRPKTIAFYRHPIETS